MKKVFKRNTIRKSMIKMHVISLILPIVLMMFYYSISYQHNVIKYLTSEKSTVGTYQSNEIIRMEKVRRSINNIILSDPDILLNEEQAVQMIGQYFKEKSEVISVIIRKNQDIIIYDGLKSEYIDEELTGIISILPDFRAAADEIKEVDAFNITHMVANNNDFYYSNGDEGSVFIIYKFDNMIKKFARRAAGHILFIFLGMLIIYGIYAYRVSKSILDPVNNMLYGMSEIGKKQYKYRIDSSSVKNEMRVLIESFNNMSEELSKTEEEKKKLENLRKDFIDNISHDLKTPLTSIKIHVAAILDGVANSPEKTNSYLNNIVKKTEDMHAMIEELAIYADLENNKEQFNKQEVDFRAFMQDLSDEFSFELENSSNSVAFSYEEKNNYMIEIDIEKMKRAIFNIFENALKYANVEHIKVKSELSLDNSQNIILRIKDNGVGINLENKDRIFEKFYREDKSRNQNNLGSGIGLSITKNVIEKNNGEICVNEQVEDGLEFIIILKR